LEDLGVDGYNIKMYLKETECEDVEWVHLVQVRGQWGDLLDTIMNFLMP
jgi:hypothetical protein